MRTSDLVLTYTSLTQFYRYRWSFHSFYHADWRMNYHPKMFAKWRAMEYEFHQLHPELGNHLALPREPSEVRDALEGYDWPNLHRQYDLCHKYNPRYESNGHFPVQDQYSVAMSYYNPERMEYLPRLIEHYLASDKYVLFERLSVITVKRAS